jgi:hypothetical protein
MSSVLGQGAEDKDMLDREPITDTHDYIYW